MNPNSPFILQNHVAYLKWREQKLRQRVVKAEDLIVEVADLACLSKLEHQSILNLCQKSNMAIYRFKNHTDIDVDKGAVIAFGAQFGLNRLDHNYCADEDGVSALQVSQGGRSQEYIPYSNRPINWHTDGYYNSSSQQVRGLILHCVRQAETGGENALLDHEIVYILLRDANPDYIQALMEPDAMTIPPNLDNGRELRPCQPGPVFSIREDNSLHMRYTARTHSIIWKQDALLKEALSLLDEIMQRTDINVMNYRLNPGEGLICNNVLHNRAGFSNGPVMQRLLFRARYYDRISGC